MQTADYSIAPLSFQQEELVENLRRYPECSQIYDLVSVFRFDGDVKAEALESALHDLIRRHALLRAVVMQKNDRLYQQTHSTQHEAVEVVGGDVTESAVRGRALSMRYPSSYVLDRPLFRPIVYASGGRASFLALGIHHLIYDGWSLQVLWRDLAELYEARIFDRAARLPALPVTYAEYSTIQRLSWDGMSRSTVDWWRAVTEGYRGDIEWPKPVPRSGKGLDPYETSSVTFTVPEDSLDMLRRAAARMKVTQFLILLAATGVAIARVTGHDDLLLASDTCNRERKEIRDLVGMCLNTKMIRLKQASRGQFADAVAVIRDGWLNADQHQDAYISPILRELGNPAFVKVNMEQLPGKVVHAPGLAGSKTTRIRTPPDLRYWRNVNVTWVPTHHGFRAEIRYRRSLISAAAAAAIAREIGCALENSL
jgi:hypothetical protein